MARLLFLRTHPLNTLVSRWTTRVAPMATSHSICTPESNYNRFPRSRLAAEAGAAFMFWRTMNVRMSLPRIPSSLPCRSSLPTRATARRPPLFRFQRKHRARRMLLRSSSTRMLLRNYDMLDRGKFSAHLYIFFGVCNCSIVSHSSFIKCHSTVYKLQFWCKPLAK